MLQAAVSLVLWLGPRTGADIQLIPHAVLQALDHMRSRQPVDALYDTAESKMSPAVRQKE